MIGWVRGVELFEWGMSLLLLTERQRLMISPPRAMILLSWNCREFVNSLTVQDLHQLVKDKSSGMVFLMETLLQNTKLEGLRRKLGFKGCLGVEPIGRSGGLAVLWKQHVNFEFHNFSARRISGWVSVHNQSKRWIWTRFYGYPETRKRAMSWDLLSAINPGGSVPWCITGDFNKILLSREKVGGRARLEKQMLDFREALVKNQLFDLRFIGDHFTWCNSHEGGRVHKRKIGYGYC